MQCSACKIESSFEMGLFSRTSLTQAPSFSFATQEKSEAHSLELASGQSPSASQILQPTTKGAKLKGDFKRTLFFYKQQAAF